MHVADGQVRWRAFILCLDNFEDNLNRRLLLMVTSHQKVHQMVGVCSLSALAFILMLFEFPILPVAPYLKMDFSDLPVLIGGFIYGPAAGVMIAFLKCLIHAMTRGFSAGELVGILGNFLSSLALLLPFCWTWKHNSWSFKRQLWLGSISATVTLVVVMALLNWWVLTPLYMALWNWKSTLPIPELIAVAVIPFNLIKGVLVSAVFALVAIRLKSWLNQKQLEQ